MLFIVSVTLLFSTVIAYIFSNSLSVIGLVPSFDIMPDLLVFIFMIVYCFLLIPVTWLGFLLW